MIFCLSKLFKQDFTNYLSKQFWIFIIMFFSIIGPISYLHFENWKE
ncbi:PLDc N-terminal domain-containing protein [Clostridium botulinum]|nr:PLDc N-terminal domain-containing protein [Clostridium botulinum]